MANNARRHDDAPAGMLFIGGDSAQTARILDALAVDGQPAMERARTLADALTRLTQPGVTSILLSLALPDSCGIATYDTIAAAAGDVPILVLCDVDDESNGRLAVSRGAEDFLPADHFDRYSLTRAVAALRTVAVAPPALDDVQQAAIALNSIGDAVVCTDVSGCVTYLNRVAEMLTGWRRAEAVGRPLQEVVNFVDGSIGDRSANPAELAIRQNKTVSLAENSVLVRRDGFRSAVEDSAAPIYDHVGGVTGAVIVFHDVSAARRVSLRLSHLAQHDALTDLPNRLLIRDRMQQAVSVARRHGCRAALLFVDLDRFKDVNDAFGHLVGDQLLKQVAERLIGAMRESDTVGRQSGDEFVIVLSDLESVDSAATAAAKVLAALAAPYDVGVHTLSVSASIGVSIYPDDAADSLSLLAHADAAMYHAKDAGRNMVQLFTESLVNAR